MLSIVIPVLVVHPVIERMTLETIKSVYMTTLGSWELIVVVHGGIYLKGTMDHPRIKYYNIEKRMGIAEAYNYGFSKSSGDLLCCLHNDVMLPFGWNYLLDKVAKEGNIGFPMLEEEAEFCKLRGIAPTQSWQTPACCFVFSRELWNKVGGYDEQFEEMHGEDIDLFRRAENVGAKLIRCDVKVYHRRGATRALTKDGGARAFVENWQKFYYKHKRNDESVETPRVSERPTVFHEYRKKEVVCNE